MGSTPLLEMRRSLTALDSCRKSIKELAQLFRVRQQRVMAIIALSIVDQQNEKAGLPMHDHFQLQMEGDYIVHPDGDYVHAGMDPCFEAVGTGEKHVKILPRAPHYEVRQGAGKV